MDLDPHRVADLDPAKVIDPSRGVLPDRDVAALEEQLAGACTVEVAAFDAFARLTCVTEIRSGRGSRRSGHRQNQT